MKSKMAFSLVLLGGLISYNVQAVDNVHFSGALIAEPCTINNNQTIEVDFGSDLGVNKIDGANYKKPVPYTIECPAGSTPNKLAIVVDTTEPTLFDTSAVDTHKDGLGIRILIDGEAAKFATPVSVSNPATPPTVEAVPVKEAGFQLTEGAFEATMTLSAVYI